MGRSSVARECVNNPSKTRVLLVEDHTIVRKGLRSLLDDEVDIEVIGEADDGREALQKTEQLRPDIVLMDIAMPGLNGLAATRQIKKRFPKVKVLILTMHANEEYVLQVMRGGASGYVVKETAVTELVSAVRAVHGGESFLSPSISKMSIGEYIRRVESMLDEDSFDKLTDRESEILQLIAEGHSNKQIAGLLHISPRTIESHKANLMGKLDLHSTAALTRYAVRKGLTGLSG